MVTQTQSASYLVTVVDLASNDYSDTCEYGPIRDYETVRILSRQPLPYSAIANLAGRYPGYTVVGVRTNDYSNDEF
jgi:hypothetical protein